MSHKSDEVVVTYLEMHAPPTEPPPRLPTGSRVMRADPPTLSFYRYLYERVGARWNWQDRLVMGDDALDTIVCDPDVAVHILYRHGTPAGFAELDHRDQPDVQLAYFGLLPAFIGRGLGSRFLDWTVHRAWRPQPNQPATERLWLHTCSEDHPRALPLYQRKGFEVFKRERRPRSA